MTSCVANPAASCRCQSLFLIPVGQENEHQRTIDGLLPADVLPSASTSALLPCWGVTDGNYLVKNRVRAQTGDVFALIRARHRRQAAYVHRLAVVEKLLRDPSACAELYKTSHDYHMGGRKKSSVPFTWIITFRSVVPVNWDKQAFLAKLGNPAHDPILSARPAVLAHQKNAAQAAQVLQECNAVLGLRMNLQQSLVPSQSLPASSQHPLRSPYQTPKGVPPKAKPLCNTEPVPKRRRFEVVDGELSTEEQPQLKRKKCTPLPASTPQPVDRQDQVVTDIQTDQACSCSLNSSQEHPVDEDDASTHCRPVGEGRDVATGTGQDTESGCVSKRPNNHVTATRPAKSADHDSRQNASTGSRAQLLAGNPQSTAWSVRSPLRAGTPSVKPNMASKEVQAEVHQGTAAGLNPGVATQDDVGNSAAVAVTQQLNVTATQEFALFGLIYHFAATKGTPWLFM